MFKLFYWKFIKIYIPPLLPPYATPLPHLSDPTWFAPSLVHFLQTISWQLGPTPVKSKLANKNS